jgi:hypothetical protein
MEQRLAAAAGRGAARAAVRRVRLEAGVPVPPPEAAAGSAAGWFVFQEGQAFKKLSQLEGLPVRMGALSVVTCSGSAF